MFKRISLWLMAYVYRVTTILAVTTLVGCTDKGEVVNTTGEGIYVELEANNFESIDLSKFAGSHWTKICFLGPYNEQSAKVLGFDWQVLDYTRVLQSDGHNILVFATETDVIEYVIHSRARGDFWQLSGECFNRNHAFFIKEQSTGFVSKNTADVLL